MWDAVAIGARVYVRGGANARAINVACAQAAAGAGGGGLQHASRIMCKVTHIHTMCKDTHTRHASQLAAHASP